LNHIVEERISERCLPKWGGSVHTNSPDEVSSGLLGSGVKAYGNSYFSLPNYFKLFSPSTTK
jgi:hypothetical protein